MDQFPLDELGILISAMEDFIRVCDLAVKFNRGNVAFSRLLGLPLV